MTKLDKRPPTVFISYTHESSEHKAWVKCLVHDLTKAGIYVHYDGWDLQLGGDLSHFMESGINGSDFFLSVCTEEYARRANDRAGGVGYEVMLASAKYLASPNCDRVICALRSGHANLSIPLFLRTKLYISFIGDAEYAASLEKLVHRFHGVPLQSRAPLGQSPFSPSPELPPNEWERDWRAMFLVPTFLKSVLLPGEVCFQAGGYRDDNENGIGDFCDDVDLLDGTKPAGGKRLQIIDVGAREILEIDRCRFNIITDFEIGFWCFVSMPSRLFQLAIDASGVVVWRRDTRLPTTPADAKDAMLECCPWPGLKGLKSEKSKKNK